MSSRRTRTTRSSSRPASGRPSSRSWRGEFDAVHVRTQDAFDTVLDHSEATDWAADRIHPNLAGHAVIAQAFLRAIGFEM